MTFKYLPILFASAAIALTSCSNIDENDRFIKIDKPDVQPTVKLKRRALVEDFTGQYCINCPAATVIINQVADFFGGDSVITVAIHSGPFGKNPQGVPAPLYTEVGDYYYDKFKIESQPSLMVNRTGILENENMLSSKVREVVDTDAILDLKVEAAYSNADGVVNIKVDAKAMQDLSGKLNVWLLEDGIVSAQMLADGSADIKYVHNHVFRVNVTAEDGEAISLKKDTDSEATFSYDIAEENAGKANALKWNPENMVVVAFVESAKGVEQSARAHFVVE